MQAAKAWGLTPSQWREASLDDRAQMMVHQWMEGHRDGYEAERIEASAEKKTSQEDGKQPVIRQEGMGLMETMYRSIR